MAGRRKNGEGSWGTKKIHGDDYVYYRDIDGKYYYGKTSKIVKEKLKQEKSKAKITIPDLEKQTFGEYMLVWLHSIKKGIEATTYQSYFDAVNSRLFNYRAYDLANVRLKDLNDKMFQAYLNSLAENYSLNSIKKVWGLIKTCVRYAEARGDIKPLYLNVTVTTPSEANVAVKKKDIKVPSSDEIKLIYDEAVSTCSNGTYKYGNAAYVVVLIMYTGMRVSEAIGLQWKDVDMERREIAVNQSLAMVKDVEKGDISYSYKIKSAKTKDSRRRILLPDKAFEAILHFRKYYQGEDGFVCVNDKNQNHYTRRLVERTLERIVKNSKCRDKSYSPHSLRHGYGSILLSMGTDIKIVSELLGHSDVSFTYNVYIDVFEQDKQSAVMKLNQI
ncbi:MAG: site-specific integrase [Lachnospiraceae bacterium]|nr:site-specific integrase [Lachnospiraceae bacterium]